MKNKKDLLISLFGVLLILAGFYLIKAIDEVIAIPLHRYRVRIIWKWRWRIYQ